MFTGWVRTIFMFQLIVYTTEISSVNKIVITEWLRLNISGFLMQCDVDDKILDELTNCAY